MQIVPAQCSYTPLSTKVEIKLAKADNAQWKQLDFDPKPQIVKTVVVPKGSDLFPTLVHFTLHAIYDYLLNFRGS